MKAKLFFAGLLVLAFLGTSGSLFAQNKETRNVSGFSAIEASSVFDITVNKAGTESLVIEADEAVMPHVRTEVKNGVLKLYLDDYKGKNIKTIKATIGVKELKKVTLSGASKLTSEDVFNTQKFEMLLSGACALNLNIKADKLKVDASGASNVTLTAEVQDARFGASGASNLKVQLKASEVSFWMSGACKAEIKGTAHEAEYRISGACNVKAEDLICKTASVKSSGAGKLSLNVSERLDINSSGSGVVLYKGRPVLNMNTSGAAKVKSLD